MDLYLFGVWVVCVFCVCCVFSVWLVLVCGLLRICFGCCEFGVLGLGLWLGSGL